MRRFLPWHIAFLIALLAVKLYVSQPSIFFDSRFDGQNILTWKFAAFRNLQPFRDVFYPYGLLNYYVYVRNFWTLLSSFVFFIIMICLLRLFEGITKKSGYAYFIFIVVFTIGVFVSGVQAFSRYGIAIAGVLFLSIVLKNKQQQSLYVFLYGLLTSLCLVLVIDQGIYLTTLFLILTLVDAIITYKNGTLKKSFTNLLKKYAIFAVGFLTGFIPAILYLLKNGILTSYITTLIQTPDVSLYAKTPYFHSLKSIPGILDFSALYVSIFYLSYVVFFKHKKISISWYALLGVTLALILYEEKSIIRSLGFQVSFVAILVYLILFFCVFEKWILKCNKIFLFISLCGVVCLFGYFLFYPIPGFSNNNSSYISNFRNTEYSNVLKIIRDKYHYTGKILSFPTDPELYITFHQDPPYYFTVYDGSLRRAQENIINYIKKNNIEYIVFNSSIRSVQDGVPDYARAPYEYSYIFRNYYAKDRVHNFIIMRKGHDAFAFNLSPKFSDLQSYFNVIDLANIPKSEGYYKKSNIRKNRILQSISKTSQLSKDSKNLYLVVYYKNNTNKQTNIKMSSLKMTTQIVFRSCNTFDPCIVNLSNVPLFYFPKHITGIEFNSKYIKRIDFVKVSSGTVFW